METKTQDPVKDTQRLEELARLRLYENEVDEILQKYVNEAAKEFDLPIGLVSIVLDDVQKFAASHGLSGWLQEVQGSPVEWAFCANSVRSGEPFVVEDSTVHEKTKENPLVTLDGVHCYAGVPLVSSRGFVLGNFCVIGDKSRSFSPEEVDRLKDYAKLAVAQIERRIEE